MNTKITAMDFNGEYLNWLLTGSLGSVLMGGLTYFLKRTISGSATKENLQAKTDLLEKDISHLNKAMDATDEKMDLLHKRITELRENSTEIYVSKELFHQTIRQLNEKLDTILKFVER